MDSLSQLLSFSEEKITACYESENNFYIKENTRLVQNELILVKLNRNLSEKLLYYEKAFAKAFAKTVTCVATQTDRSEVQTKEQESQTHTISHTNNYTQTVQSNLNIINVSNLYDTLFMNLKYFSKYLIKFKLYLQIKKIIYVNK